MDPMGNVPIVCSDVNVVMLGLDLNVDTPGLSEQEEGAEPQEVDH